MHAQFTTTHHKTQPKATTHPRKQASTPAHSLLIHWPGGGAIEVGGAGVAGQPFGHGDAAAVGAAEGEVGGGAREEARLDGGGGPEVGHGAHVRCNCGHSGGHGSTELCYAAATARRDCGEELALEGGRRWILGADRGESEREAGKYTNKQRARRREGDGIEWIALESSSSSHWPPFRPPAIGPRRIDEFACGSPWGLHFHFPYLGFNSTCGVLWFVFRVLHRVGLHNETHVASLPNRRWDVCKKTDWKSDLPWLSYGSRKCVFVDFLSWIHRSSWSWSLWSVEQLLVFEDVV